MSTKRDRELAAVIARLRGGERRLPPVNDWQPAASGEIDIRIAADGEWFYLGSRIQRPAMVRLFASVLRREDNGYYLVTPVEKLRIEVEDAPFIAIRLTRDGSDTEPVLCFETNVDDRVIADAEHPIRLQAPSAGATRRPYIRVRDRLDALISRSLYYELVDMAQLRNGAEGEELVLRSAGSEFALGTINE